MGKTICLFDVDGTLTKPRLKIEQPMLDCLTKVHSKIALAIVSGSDQKKVVEQLGNNFEKLSKDFDYLFFENGLVGYRGDVLINRESIALKMGEENLQKFTNFCLGYLAKLVLPMKRGTFIEFRNGMLNISPIGRNCSQQERDAFGMYDEKHKIREKMVEAMKIAFPVDEYQLQFSIGGQISVDVFPVGWDKRHCLQKLTKDQFSTIHFIGDKTHPGGNDYEIFEDPLTIGHTVTCPEETVMLLEKLFLKCENGDF